MQLELDSKKGAPNPDETAIREALARMKCEAVLRRDEVSYVKTSCDEEEGFPLEYQEDSTENHFKAIGNFSRARVTEVFIAFSKGDTSWKTLFQWVKVPKEAEEAEDSGQQLGCGVGLVLGGILLLAEKQHWIPTSEWVLPCILVGWGSSYLYTFFTKSRRS